MEKSNVNNQIVGGGLSEVELVEEFLHENYEYRNNVLSKQIEFRERTDSESVSFRVLSREAQNSIVLRCRKELGDDVKGVKSLVDAIINSEQTPTFDPIVEYLNALPEWDGVDRVEALANCIPELNDKQKNWFATWLRSAVAHWLHMDTLHGNECVPTFIGSQGCGKSTFCQRLLPVQFRGYYLDHINLGNKFDKEMAMTNNLIVNIDELDQVKASQQAELKQTLSKSKVNGRQIYGRVQTDRHRYASFVSTTNNLHPLHDSTGSRRYLCFVIPDGQLIDNDTPIEYDQLYAQLVYELRQKEMRYWFTNAETMEIEQANSRFRNVVDLDEMIANTLRQPQSSENIIPLKAVEVFSMIQKVYPEVESSCKTLTILGKRLRTMGFEAKHTKAGTVYYVVPVEAA